MAELLKIAQWELERELEWSEDIIRKRFEEVCEKEGLRLKQLMLPYFVALSGSAVSLPVFSSMQILGRDMTLRRLQYAQEALAGMNCGLSKKKIKKLEADYKARYGR